VKGLLSRVAQLMAEKNLPGLMIGGHAVTAMAKRQVVPIATPSVEAMIALKLHAAKHRNAAEAERDWSDLIALMRIHQLSLDDASFAAMVERHGGTAAIERIQKAFAQ
jgi:hypothetical protein